MVNKAIIVCDHGMGHLRRCALMAKKMQLEGDDVTLYAPAVSMQRLTKVLPQVNDLKVIDFSTYTVPERINDKHLSSLSSLDRLANLGCYDEVISDNVIEVLEIRPDAVISANFFWHDVLKDASPEYVNYCNKLLAARKPTVLGSSMFAMPLVQAQPNFKSVGLFPNPYLKEYYSHSGEQNQQDLLITGGTTTVLSDVFRSIIKLLLAVGIKPYRKAYVEPMLMPVNAPEWMVPADFTVEMYSRVATGLCRPGLGVVTDLLTVNASIIPVVDHGNKEIEYNASILSSVKDKNLNIKGEKKQEFKSLIDKFMATPAHIL